ncbi:MULTISPECIES: carbon storage regulator [Pirellulaceae]|uniref:Translational regulator CsrA n=1 Tax=Aporhodopirellula rubra TaxID=980271 RepID=A0A7W5H3I5_9BACT|nr:MULTISPECIES: carbon storage regulator [Pirellulaceae]EMI46465.1 Carbon storage regulator [Rhodopirellula sp. SWK7]MBB3204354.1 carbon storage regulator [Aporhodopirellula rubra]
MLVLSRKIGDKILIGDDVKIVVTKISLNRVRIAIDAPTDMVIKRAELCQAVQECFAVVPDSKQAAPLVGETSVPALTS